MSIQSEYKGKTIIVEDSERQECEIWTRVMGYFRPVQDWNIGKQQENKDRVFFKEPQNVG